MENGNYYIGQFKKGKRHGKGKSYDKDGNLFYEGDFINELPNGKGIMYFDGNKYEGDLVDGKFEGNGKFYYYEEDREYIGQFKNGNMNGKGNLYDKNGKVIYEGDFVDGKFEGNGKLFNDDGSYYIGQFRNDLKHGKGIEYDKDGNELGDVIYKEGEKCGKLREEWKREILLKKRKIKLDIIYIKELSKKFLFNNIIYFLFLINI